MRLAILVAGTALALSALAGDLPDPQRTPGAVNTNVTTDNIDETICVPGFTKTIRPPASYTNRLKRKQIEEYGYTETDPKLYEEDHCIPLTLGGHPRDPHNLWPQPYAGEWGAKKKDRLEVRLNRLVCNGDLSLEDAQQMICSPKGNWIEAYKKYLEKR